MKYKLLLIAGALALLTSCHRDKPLAGAGQSGNYFPVKEYTLKNGLKVYISVNKNAPRIQTAITVKAGSKFDPPQTTGLAHYLEHMLFKGTAHYGTADYAIEKHYLDALSELFEIDAQSPKLSSELSEAFASRVAKVLYLAKRVRSDILITVNFLTTRVREPTVQDWGKLVRLLQYINATSNMGMVLEATKSLQLLAYIDASFAVHHDYKSHTGVILSLGAGPVFA
jgi:hypothetical protein